MEQARRYQSIALYGKSGSGRSTTTSNLAAALAKAGNRVVLIGCDPNDDSTVNLCAGRQIPTVVEAVRDGHCSELAHIATEGYSGVLCVEVGSNDRASSCAGHGIPEALALLGRLHLVDVYNPDVVLYDVASDSLCHDFALPIGAGLAERAYVVTSSDFSALNATNTLFSVIRGLAAAGGARLGGIIGNDLAALYGRSILDNYAHITGTRILASIARSTTISKNTHRGRTVIEASPTSYEASLYRSLAEILVTDTTAGIPKPLARSHFREWMHKWEDLIMRAEECVVGERGGI